jgi:DnaJ-class molecular chaperone
MKQLRLLLLFSFGQLSSSSPNKAEFRSNPYEVLGVPTTATQKEIQRQYRNLCLQHHPDKNKSLDDDHAFKEVQHAYSLIGSEESRHYHDLKQIQTQHNINNGVFENVLFQPSNVFGSSSTVYFTFGNGGGVSFKFSNGRGGRFGTRRVNTYRPHYRQKVVIPLEVLYAGGKGLEINLKTSILERYKASYGGGLLAPIVMQAIFTVMMTWLRSQKVNWFLSIFLFGIMIHTNIPSAPQKTKYTTNVPPGLKGGTNLSFKTSTEDVTFFVDEGRHERYTRSGNDLHANIYVSKKRLRKGCTLKLDPLCDSEPPIKIKILPRQIKQDGEIINIIGRGWPKARSRGDLKVKIFIKKRRR